MQPFLTATLVATQLSIIILLHLAHLFLLTLSCQGSSRTNSRATRLLPAMRCYLLTNRRFGECKYQGCSADDDDEVSFISRFRLRPLMSTRQERPGMYLS
jgi:hypothetical protein